MQDEVALAIAREINVELTPKEKARFATSRTVNPEAHEAYLKGRYFLDNYSEARVRKAIDQFEQAIKIDPNFMLAYTGLSDAYGYSEDWYLPANEVMPKAKAAAEKALQLDPSAAEAHTSLAFVIWQYDYDWAGGEREYLRAIELNPNYYEAHHQYGYLLAFGGRFDESVAEFKRANEMDPLSAGILNDLAWPLMFQRKVRRSPGEDSQSIGIGSELLPRSIYPGMDRHRIGQDARGDRRTGEGARDGCSAVRDRLSWIRLRGVGRSRQSRRLPSRT